MLFNQFALVLQRPLALVFHVPSAAWSEGASKVELAATRIAKMGFFTFIITYTNFLNHVVFKVKGRFLPVTKL
jgi:hypothetical protein